MFKYHQCTISLEHNYNNLDTGRSIFLSVKFFLIWVTESEYAPPVAYP